MTPLSAETATILMLACVFLGVFFGFPLAFVIGTIALVFGYIRFGDEVLFVLYTRAFDGILEKYILLAVPAFVFMGLMLERSGIAEKLFDALYLWLGGLRGGLAVVTVLIGTIMAATIGIIAASCTMLALVALPAMVNRGYSKTLACGSVCAGGTLGILIPPSVMLVLYGPMAQISVGKLFFAAFIPGFLLSGLYTIYILIYSFIKPNAAPGVPPEEMKMPFLIKTRMLFTSLIPPVLLILAVLGTIFFGIAPPTEAAGIGAFAATVLVIAYRKFTWKILGHVSLETVKVCGFIFMILIMAYSFVGVFMGSGGGQVAKEVILSTPGGKWGILGIVMFMCFILGFFIDWLAILFLLIPVITPIGAALGFDPLWFAMMIVVNFQMSFMTPPFAWAIWIVRGAAPPELGITMGDIIKGVVPFVLLIMVGLGLMVAFPQLVLWLPAQMIRR